MCSGANHFLSLRGAKATQLEAFFTATDRMAASQEAALEPSCPHLISLFYEPSLRTQVSFEMAMLRLGGRTLGGGSMTGTRANSSHEESLADAARVLSGYADVVVLRHPSPGALAVFAAHSSVPVVNAGNGNGLGAEHPSQALCDLYTIRRHFGHIDGLTFCLLGSLQKRAVRSLLLGLAAYPQVVVLVPTSCPIPLLPQDRAYAEEHGVTVQDCDSVDDAICCSDVIYHGGLSADWQPQLGEEFFLTAARLRKARAAAIVMHPLPRPGSISVDVDGTPHARYFECARHGVAVRMALLKGVLAGGVLQ